MHVAIVAGNLAIGSAGKWRYASGTQLKGSRLLLS